LSLRSSTMGRKPNPLILEYFERGPKHNDNSNRYPHTCKLCGEYFERGRLEALTNHITKRCPAISEADKIRACLTLGGIHGVQPEQAHTNGQQNGTTTVDLPLLPHPQWSALETLAEASRQVNMSEKRGGHDQGPTEAPASPANPATPHGTGHFEVQEQFTLDNPPSTRLLRERKGMLHTRLPVFYVDI
jgi:hypothetical protein